MALWGNNDNIAATGRVTLDYVTGIVTGSNLEDQGNGTKFGETGEIQVGDILRFGEIEKPGVYMGDAVVVSIAGTTSLTIGSTMGLDGVSIARTTFQANQAPKFTVLDSSYSESDLINDESPSVRNTVRLTANSATETTGVGKSIVDIKTTFGETGDIKVGDFLVNDSSNISVVSIGTATFHANFNSGVGSDRVFVNGLVPGLDFSTGIIIDETLHIATAIGATSIIISPNVTAGISTGEVIRIDSLVDATGPLVGEHHFVIQLSGPITSAISVGDALQFKRLGGGYSKNVYGISTAGAQAANGTIYEAGIGWVGVTTYINNEGELRVKKEILVAGVGIQTGNTPSYPNVQHAN